MITKADIEKLAKLSRLKLTEAEKEKYAKDMENILAYVKQIDAVTPAAAEEISLASSVRATAGAPLKSSYARTLPASEPRNVMREDDKPHESGIFTDELIKLAPRCEKNRVKVKKIL